MNRKLKIVMCLAIALAVAAAFGSGLSGGFHWDDAHAILKNPSVRSLGAAFASFVDPRAFSAYRLPMIRPLTIITYAINYRLGEFNPPGWHLLNFIIHIASAIAVLNIALLLLGAKSDDDGEKTNSVAALFAALIFATHPVQSETLNYFSARSALMSAAFCLFALYFHLQFNFSRKLIFKILAALFFIFALASREDASVFPALALAVDFIFSAGIDREKTKFKILNSLPYWAIFLAYMFYRKLLLSVFAAEGFVRGPVEQLAIDIWAIGLYHQLFFFPAGLSVRHTAPAAIHSSPLFWLGVCAVAVEIAAFFYFIKRRPIISALIAFFYAALSPTLVIPLNMAASEHRLYLPVVAPAILAGYALKNIFKKRIDRAIIATCLVTIIFIPLSQSDSARWRDEVSLWLRETQKADADATAWLQYGKALKDAGQFGGAIEAYRRSIQIEPTAGAYNNLSIACEIAGDTSCAYDAMMSALKAGPDDPTSNMNYALYLMQQEKFEEAAAHFKIAVANRDVFPEAHKNLAIALMKQQPQPAQEILYHLKKSIEQDPYQDEANAMRATILQIEQSLNRGQ